MWQELNLQRRPFKALVRAFTEKGRHTLGIAILEHFQISSLGLVAQSVDQRAENLG